MKRQWILTSVSALIVCCLFVFIPAKVSAATTYTPSGEYYKNVIVYLYPSTATSTSNAQLYASWMITQLTTIATSDAGNEEFQTIYKCKFLLRNTTVNDLIIPSTYISIKPTFTLQNGVPEGLIDVEYIAGQLMVDRVNTSGSFYFSNAPDHSLNSNIIVPALGDICCVFNLYIDDQMYSMTNFAIQWVNPSLPFTPVVVESGDPLVSSYDEYLKWIFFRANTIYDALISQAQSGSDTVDTGEDTQTQIETIHGEEQTWFTGTETAIEGTGLSTFSFTGDAGTGITGVKDQFVDVWNAMGMFSIVPIFALSLKLATTIIRHRPEKRRIGNDVPSHGRVLQGGYIETTHKNGDRSGVIW